MTLRATAATEGPLVELARHTTAAQLDRIAQGPSPVGTGNDADKARRRHEARHLHWFWDEDGSLVLTARLGADEGALVLQALDAAAHALRAGAPGTIPPTIPRDRTARSAIPRDHPNAMAPPTIPRDRPPPGLDASPPRSQ